MSIGVVSYLMPALEGHVDLIDNLHRLDPGPLFRDVVIGRVPMLLHLAKGERHNLQMSHAVPVRAAAIRRLRSQVLPAFACLLEGRLEHLAVFVEPC